MTDVSGWAKNHRMNLPGNAILPAAAGVVQSANREIGVPGFQSIRGELRFIRIPRNEAYFLGAWVALLLKSRKLALSSQTCSIIFHSGLN